MRLGRILLALFLASAAQASFFRERDAVEAAAARQRRYDSETLRFETAPRGVNPASGGAKFVLIGRRSDPGEGGDFVNWLTGEDANLGWGKRGWGGLGMGKRGWGVPDGLGTSTPTWNPPGSRLRSPDKRSFFSRRLYRTLFGDNEDSEQLDSLRFGKRGVMESMVRFGKRDGEDASDGAFSPMLPWMHNVEEDLERRMIEEAEAVPQGNEDYPTEDYYPAEEKRVFLPSAWRLRLLKEHFAHRQPAKRSRPYPTWYGWRMGHGQPLSWHIRQALLRP